MINNIELPNNNINIKIQQNNKNNFEQMKKQTCKNQFLQYKGLNNMTLQNKVLFWQSPHLNLSFLNFQKLLIKTGVIFNSRSSRNLFDDFARKASDVDAAFNCATFAFTTESCEYHV